MKCLYIPIPPSYMIHSGSSTAEAARTIKCTVRDESTLMIEGGGLTLVSAFEASGPGFEYPP